MIPFWLDKETAEVSEVLHLYTSAVVSDYLQGLSPKSQMVYAICHRSKDIHQAINTVIAMSCNNLDEPVEAVFKVLETPIAAIEKATKAGIPIPGFASENIAEEYIPFKEKISEELYKQVCEIESACGRYADVSTFTALAAITTNCPKYAAPYLLLNAKIAVVSALFHRLKSEEQKK